MVISIAIFATVDWIDFLFEQIGKEALHCRTNAAMFDQSHFGKLYISGTDAEALMNWLCTADLGKPYNSSVHLSTPFK